ncbi:MAG: SNF2-related protein [Gammaproteobacteria bacterium]
MARRQPAARKVPSAFDWRTTDEEEVERRRIRAHTERFTIRNRNPRHPIFSNFRVGSESGLDYSVEVRDLRERQFACSCVDFRINGLGTCKHVEAVLLHLEARYKKPFKVARENGGERIDIVPDAAGTLRAVGVLGDLPKPLRDLFDAHGLLRHGAAEEAIKRLTYAAHPRLRISQEVEPWILAQRRALERKALRNDYECRVQAGTWPAQETTVPLFPYQREGMLHLAFHERALLADEMGLGKTIQAIAACALLHRLGQAQRVLIVTPASLKTEWEEQIRRFTPLAYQIVFGGPKARLGAYGHAPFFTIVNYEQMVKDALTVNAELEPDIVILDEAQRIKNWSTKTAQAIKRLESRYAFVLTGTPIENRIDEIHSLMDFLDPTVLGPLFRFNREFYQLDDRGRPCGYQNLASLNTRIKPYMLRRRKADVETELPDRTDKTFFVPLSDGQKQAYTDHEDQVMRLAAQARRRPLTQSEQDKLQRELAMMRMICDTNYILDPNDAVCPKLGELEKILEECRDNADVKVIIFSEWERMLLLVRDLCKERGLGCAWHTGSVPQLRRRAEINLFKTDPECRLFLTTDAGSTGLNLQNASVVINCDLPWNPARLEQRIARAWRKHQTRPVTVIHLVSEGTIEHRMLGTLAQKQALAEGVLDLKGDLDAIAFGGGKQAFLERLNQLVGTRGPGVPPPAAPVPTDRAQTFALRAKERLGAALVRCEEEYPLEGEHSVILCVVERDADRWRSELEALHREIAGPGKGDPLAPLRLEVMDRHMAETLERLAQAGLLRRTTRGTRPLLGDGAVAAPRAALSEAERAKARACRGQAERRLKMSRVLGAAELAAEGRQALLEAVQALGGALAVEHRLAEPKTPADVVAPSLAWCWGEGLPLVKTFLAEDSAECEPLALAIERLLTARGPAA